MTKVIPLESIQRRQKLLRAQLHSRRLNAYIVFSPENLRYLTGYTGEAACLLFSLDYCYLITDYRFVQQATTECQLTQIIERDRDAQSLGQCLAALCNEFHLTAIAFESDKVSVAQWQKIALDLAGYHCTPLNSCIEELRKKKEAWEVEQIRQAARIGDEALAIALRTLKLGVTEKAFATTLEYQLAQLGSEGIAFATIAVFGENTALPHGMPSQKSLADGDFITIDFGAVVNGYRSDMTRSYIYGSASDKQLALIQTVLKAQQAALNILRPGISACEANTRAQEILEASEFAQHAGPGLGHGLGLFLHEQPHIGAHCMDQLSSGFVVTVEPGIYIPNFGGARFEDDVLITHHGIEILTQAPKHYRLPHENN
ncbi:Xaa-Pro peptidase family protein [Simiduia curdlanivorans]|uniref:M24 family metallopeptidase n=1 Tax=Simiduia curdlanivorans TaxID=1492769 RepID=A0ABV8V1S7_9GAMM|nr:Xaa-Pro peptidase family protein [Simiduia curdlanivorans]MDN3640071.1 Xaa-Pro peptidase family protein [Simiduia curdlanivorans]